MKGKSLDAITEYADGIVFNDSFPTSDNAPTAKLRDLIASLHRDCMSEEDARAFLFSELIMFNQLVSDNGKRCPSDAEQAGLRIRFVAHLKARIEALPDRYVVRIELPSFAELPASEIRISDFARVRIDAHQIESAETKYTSRLAQALSGIAPKAPLVHAHLEIDAVGFCDGSSDSSTASRCHSIAKQCAFLMTVSGAAHNGWERKTASATFSPSPYGSGSSEFSLSHSLSKCYGNLTPDRSKWKVYDVKAGQSLLGGQLRSPENDDERISALQESLAPIERFLACAGEPDHESLAAAMEWHQDSIFADNQTFSFLAACIGLEALLGSDVHMDAMSRRLADRYAFLMGRGRTERTALAQRYEAVLNLRGKLVHAKAARLNAEDRSLLYQAQAMLAQLIWHEMHEMYRTMDRQEKNRAGNPSRV